MGVSLDKNKARWMKAIGDYKLSWHQLSDLQGGIILLQNSMASGLSRPTCSLIKME